MKDCDQILARADWVPSYEEWSATLNLDDPVLFPHHATHPKSENWDLYPWQPGDWKLFGADNVTKYPAQVAVFGMSRFKIEFLQDVSLRQTLLHSTWGRQQCEQLYAWGANFLYGMLYRYSFDFAEQLKKGLLSLPLSEVESNTPKSRSNDPTTTYTIALHSRHRYSSINGCNIEAEWNCLDQMMTRFSAQATTTTKSKRQRPRQRPPQTRFQVSIMSDRVCTIDRLSEQLTALNITVLVAAHTTGDSFNEEHGPFAGVGFFQDWALASSQARSGFIGTTRSSSDLVLELIDYNRKMEWWKTSAKKNVTELGEIDVCILGQGRGTEE